jgi:D-inositol-3-phosphate glycosyltransferase
MTGSLRIALVSEHASPLAVLGGVDAGGQNVHVAALSRALAERGHDVRVFTRRDDPTTPNRVRLAPGVEVVHVDAGPAEPLPKDALLPHMGAFAEVLVRSWTPAHPTHADDQRRSGPWRPDLVHAHFWMSGMAARTAARAVGIPLAVTFHALGSVKARHQGRADTSPACRIGTEASLARDADAVLATCRDEVAELTALGAPLDRLHIVPCGVDTATFAPAGPSPAAVPGGGNAARVRLLCVGRLVERKGVDDAIRALARLVAGERDEPLDVELAIVGGPPAGSLGCDPEARRLSALAAGLGVADRVRLLGRVGPRELPARLRAADIVVAAPWYEPFGIVPLEAMACGRPVVGSAVGGLLDSVVDGRTGLLVPPRDPGALAAAIRALAVDPARREQLGRAGRQRSLSYDWSRIAARTEDVYRPLLRPKASITRSPAPAAQTLAPVRRGQPEGARS